MPESHAASIDRVVILIEGDAITPTLRETLRTKRYESFERYQIQKYLCPDYSTIDLGASVGCTTLLSDVQTDESARVAGIEANESLAPLLKRTRVE